MCRTYGAYAFWFLLTQRLRTGLTCAAPLALRNEDGIATNPGPGLKPVSRVRAYRGAP